MCRLKIVGIVFVIFNLYAEPQLVNINGIVRFIDKDCSFTLADWLDNKDSFFKYMVVQQRELWENDPLSSQKLINAALNDNIITEDGYCSLTEKYLGQTIKNTHLEAQLAQRLFDAIVDDCLIIKEVSLPHSISLNETGTFNHSSLAAFLEHCYVLQKIKNDDFKELSTARITTLTDHYFIQQVFQLSTEKHEYIIREMTFGQDKVARLACGKETPELHPFHYPLAEEGYPSFIFPFCYLSYVHHGERHILAIMHKAPGKQLSEYMQEYKNNPSQVSLEKAKRAYYRTGTCWAKLQRHFMRPQPQKIIGTSVTHGDFHHFHVFYDESNEHISIIDNEYVAYYFTYPRCALDDITNFFDETLGPSLTKPEFYEGFNKAEWIKATLYEFLSGYMSEFPRESHAALVDEIKKAFEAKIDRWRQYYENQDAFDDVLTRLIKNASV